MDALGCTHCPHCGAKLVRWENPQLSNWTGGFQHVCFNDECPYFVRGWRWMNERFSVNASYRFRYDPATGETGPLPVWSRDALRANILPEEETEAAHAE
jgi:hypothetical protein